METMQWNLLSSIHKSLEVVRGGRHNQASPDFKFRPRGWPVSPKAAEPVECPFLGEDAKGKIGLASYFGRASLGEQLHKLEVIQRRVPAMRARPRVSDVLAALGTHPLPALVALPQQPREGLVAHHARIGELLVRDILDALFHLATGRHFSTYRGTSNGEPGLADSDEESLSDSAEGINGTNLN